MNMYCKKGGDKTCEYLVWSGTTENLDYVNCVCTKFNVKDLTLELSHDINTHFGEGKATWKVKKCDKCLEDKSK